jgi:hypothetical protein
MLAFVFLVSCGGGSDPAPMASGGSQAAIQDISLSESSIEPGGDVTLTAVTDPSSCAPVSYHWEASEGTLSATDTQSVTWTAPGTEGACDVTVTATCAGGASDTETVSIEVAALQAEAPLINGITPGEAKKGEEIALTGTGFGESQGTGVVNMGGDTLTHILGWSDTRIDAVVPDGASTGKVTVTVDGVESNTEEFALLWTKENPENVAIHMGEGDESPGGIVPDGEGGTIITWAHYDYLEPESYARRVDASGEPVWAARDVLLTPSAGRWSVVATLPDGQGGAVLIMMYRYPPGSGIYRPEWYAQRIDVDGNILWPSEAPVVVDPARRFSGFGFVPDGTGGAITVLQEINIGDITRLYAQKLMPDGQVAWPHPGVLLSTGLYANDKKVAEDGLGGALLAWTSGGLTNAPDEGWYILAQRVDGDGVARWGGNGIPIAVGTDGDVPGTLLGSDVGIAPDGSGGGYVAWDSWISPTRSLHIQKVDPAGNLLWGPDGVVVHEWPDPSRWGVPLWAFADGAGGTTVVWQSSDETEIFAQRVDAEGTLLWGPSPVKVSLGLGDLATPSLAADGEGGVLISWGRGLSYEDRKVYAQKIDSEGRVRWSPGGEPIATGPGNKYVPNGPRITHDGLGGAVISWTDERTVEFASDVYAQGISAGGRQ